jgi:hypothetical protein
LLSFFSQPLLGIRLIDDGQNAYLVSGHIVKYPDIANPQPILRLLKATKPFDATLARPFRLVPQMFFNRGPHRRLVAGSQFPEIAHSLLRQQYSVFHPGRIIARFWLYVKTKVKYVQLMVAAPSI